MQSKRLFNSRQQRKLKLISQQYHQFDDWRNRQLQLCSGQSLISAGLLISTLNNTLTFDGKLKCKPRTEYYQAQIDLIFWKSDQLIFKSKKYVTLIKNRQNASLRCSVMTRDGQLISSLKLSTSSLLLFRISVNGFVDDDHDDDDHNDACNHDTIHVSKQEVIDYICRMPDSYVEAYTKMQEEHLRSKHGQLIIPDLPEIVKKLLYKKKKDQQFYQHYISKRRVFDPSKYVLVPKRQLRRTNSKWNQYQSTTTTIRPLIDSTSLKLPNFEPTQEEILYQLDKHRNKEQEEILESQTTTKPKCPFLIFPSAQERMRMKIIVERQNLYYSLKYQDVRKLKGILKTGNRSSNNSTTIKKLRFNLSENRIKICSRWIKLN